jgi:hypothetical protein
MKSNPLLTVTVGMGLTLSIPPTSKAKSSKDSKASDPKRPYLFRLGTLGCCLAAATRDGGGGKRSQAHPRRQGKWGEETSVTSQILGAMGVVYMSIVVASGHRVGSCRSAVMAVAS